jgi:hypothetical protein
MSSAVADDTLRVLLVLRLVGSATDDGVVAGLDRLGVAVEDPIGLLGRIELAGLVEVGAGATPRWRLAADGRAEGERLLAVDRHDRGDEAELTAAYDRFLARNGEALGAFTAWQLRDPNPSAPIVNDHTDASYDERVVARLRGLHAAVLPVVADLGQRRDRFARYGARFDDALARVEAGDRAAVDGPDVDSFHAVWFELHEHLLATLGRDRASEPVPVVPLDPPDVPPI